MSNKLIVYVSKEVLSNYQIIPAPPIGIIGEFYVVEIECADNLPESEFIVYGEECIIVPKRPSPLHKWTQRGWTITKANRLVLDAEQAAEDEAVAKANVASLRAECDRDILPLQDAVDLDEATAEEADRLKALKRYRIALSRWKYPEEIPTKP